jgi:hypothetical protein
MYIYACELVHVVAAKRKWTIATARQHLPELVGMAAREPQRVYRRDKLVAAVVSPELADEVENLRRPTLAMKLVELQRLCAEDNYELTAPPRRDRANPFSSRRVRGQTRGQQRKQR